MVATFRESGLVAWAEASGQRRTSGRAGAAAGAGRGAGPGHGHIVAELFDEGESRSVAWGRRPQAAALVALLADACRIWDAIVVGEYERAGCDGR